MDQDIAALSQLPPWACQPGAQPIAGYRLIEPLGRGGFGEVWKCEAPGGLVKAIKFVHNRGSQDCFASQELESLQRVKSIRHPFILSLERVEVVGGVLIVVMELADTSLYGLLGDYQSRNVPGIPREELLGYLLEAAEALDWMNFGHGLQHLDIKPHNLFLISNHVKVADFGLVDRLSDVERSQPHPRNGGVTPLYGAPELVHGNVSRHSDQYSLAIVYQQLLTGTVPFWCQNLYELMRLHVSAEPNLTPLPAEDRPVVARALAKTPEERFPSCLDFLQALVCGDSGAKVDLRRRASAVKKIVSALHGSEKPTKSVRRVSVPTPTEPTRTEPTPEPRPAAGSGAVTVPTNTENESRTVLGPNPATIRTPPTAINDPTPARSRREPAPASVGLSLPGYRFLHRVSQNPLGDIWKVEDEQGRPRRALCLHNFVEHDLSLIERLRGLSHPALPPAVVAWSPVGRLILITEEFEQTLRDRLEAYHKQSQPGIPREELLGHLHTVAEALDALHQRYGLPHLGLNPRTLVMHNETICLTEFGLVPLIWLPTGQTGGSLNGRYAAPELFDKPNLTGIPPGELTRMALMGRAGPASDQYSLAMIYAEMLSGMPPRAPRSGSGVHRRPNSGQHRVVGRGDSWGGGSSGPARMDLDLLPACDRDILQRALHDDPAQRFANCTALIEALETAVSRTRRLESLYRRLPAVIPFSSLEGEPPPKDVVLPPVRPLVFELAAPALAAAGLPRVIRGPQNVRYVLHPGDSWECKCPIQIFAGALPLKVEGFRGEWRGRILHESDTSFAFQIDMPVPPRPEDRYPAPARLAFELDVQLAPASPKHFAEARMRVRPAGADLERTVRLLPELAPRLFDSMRGYLQAGAEQRAEDRWQCPQPLHVYPVLPDLELDEVLDGISRNISLGGVSFRVAKAPRAEQAYLHWHKSPTVSRFAVLVRIIRVQPMAGGGFEVGAAFPKST